MKSVSRITTTRALLAGFLTTLAIAAEFAKRLLLREVACVVDLPAQVPTTASLRKLLQFVLLSDSDLDAFCLDHFPAVRRRFAHGMDRIQKLNTLLEQADPTAVLAWLGEDYPHKLNRYLHILRYEE